MFCYKNMTRKNLLDIFNTNRQYQKKILSEAQDKNVRYASSIFRCILFLAKQGLALRGSSEGETSFNRGNFRELLKFMRFDNAILSDYAITNKNMLQSPEIQNEMIDIIGDKIRAKIKGYKRFVILTIQKSRSYPSTFNALE